MNRQISVFSNAAGNIMTIVAAQGKSGFNVKASIKMEKGKGTAKALTGARSSFENAAEAQDAYTALVEQAVAGGWTRVDKRVRNAFTEIPAADAVQNLAPRLVKGNATDPAPISDAAKAVNVTQTSAVGSTEKPARHRKSA